MWRECGRESSPGVHRLKGAADEQRRRELFGSGRDAAMREPQAFSGAPVFLHVIACLSRSDETGERRKRRPAVRGPARSDGGTTALGAVASSAPARYHPSKLRSGKHFGRAQLARRPRVVATRTQHLRRIPNDGRAPVRITAGETGASGWCQQASLLVGCGMELGRRGCRAARVQIIRRSSGARSRTTRPSA